MGWGGRPTRERLAATGIHAVEVEEGGEDGGEPTSVTARHDTPLVGNTVRVCWPATVGFVVGKKKVPPSSTLAPSTGTPTDSALPPPP